ncbi:MocR-like pyridoxine biosynthesis transcription factor PdxR [Anaerocolumna xylanovorans]|uniref:GntR family transcriptional regulator / MocR family aminotransferase n=1 Tax=Anaerocolumna xylanovorans DSM 12503 TaxID=1121345 RepID=A0A1M7YAU0_9FIRM|nr:PLP-dependent aminotransferase family protein [Anaerocolumna xylanovorans]SHO49735.1 GntR family transcriptional regulator / MocR family aminotransferase [Anaerocolumna xylanovorans DSM 12503]
MLSVPIDLESPVPMYEQIYSYIKNDIKDGRLTERSKLPSARSLATHLNISRNTVDMAYSQLVSEGYIESVPKSGFYVAAVSALASIPLMPLNRKENKKEEKKSFLYDFSPFAIDINSFPHNIWRKLSKDCMNEYNNELFLLGDSKGDESLRNAIAGYLYSSRGVICSPEQIIVGAGTDYLLLLLSKLFSVQKTDNPVIIAMENPTYKRAYEIFTTGMQFEVLPVGLDQNGIRVDKLSGSKADVVYVTPSHQYPLGLVMPVKRRQELLSWASLKNERYIIEDDHDSEFRYKGKPIPALKGMDSLGKVIYLGTFSRAIAPAIRVGYMVLPEELLTLYKKHLGMFASTVSRVDQYIITHFLADGYFERHLNKIRTLYKNKHDLLLQALKIFQNKIILEGEHAGLHLVVYFKTSLTEKELLDLACSGGIKLYGLNRHYIVPGANTLPGILLGYANLSEDEIKKGTLALYEILKDFLTD